MHATPTILGCNYQATPTVLKSSRHATPTVLGSSRHTTPTVLRSSLHATPIVLECNYHATPTVQRSSRHAMPTVLGSSSHTRPTGRCNLDGQGEMIQQYVCWVRTEAMYAQRLSHDTIHVVMAVGVGVRAGFPSVSDVSAAATTLLLARALGV